MGLQIRLAGPSSAVAGKATPFRGLPDNLWTQRWRATGETVRLTDPLYGNARQLSVVEIDGERGSTRFAVVEVSNGVYLFAEPLK